MQTERLILRKLTVYDATAMFKNWAGDPEVTRYVTWNTHRSVEDTIDYLKIASGDPHVLGIVLKAENKLIGSIGVTPSADDEKILELGYVLARPYIINPESLKHLERRAIRRRVMRKVIVVGHILRLDMRHPLDVHVDTQGRKAVIRTEPVD